MTSEVTCLVACRHIGYSCELYGLMVLCIVVGYSKRSGRDKDVSFFRIPTIISHRTKKDRKLSTERRAG